MLSDKSSPFWLKNGNNLKLFINILNENCEYFKKRFWLNEEEVRKIKNYEKEY